jgi:PAS domain S-box-containing protein
MDESLVASALQAGAQDYLIKIDADMRTLARAVRYAIERERYGRQLWQSGQRFRSLIEHTLDIISIVDAEGVLVFGSPATQTLLGMRPEDLAGRRLADCVHPDDAAAVHMLIDGLFAGALAPRTAAFRLQHANGAWISFEAIGCRLRDAARPQLQAVLNLRDVTARLQAEEGLRQRDEQLRQAQKMEAIGRLAGGIAHDFGNLLTVINGASDQLLEALPEGSPVRKEALTIKSTAERAARMTQKLLAVGRDRVATTPVPAIDLREVVGAAEPILRRLVGDGIEIVTTSGPRVGAVRADKGQIERVLFNLVVNARDAMPEGGRITIDARNVDVSRGDATAGLTAGAYVLLSVTDTGVGMDARTCAHALEPFFTTKKPGQGTGLGLSTVYGILSQGGGHIRLLSEPGSGTSVLCYLPRLEDAATVVDERMPTRPKAPRGTETLLVVEDEDGVRELVRDMLEMAGYRVLDASRPTVAERLCREHQGTIDMLLTDIVMPEMSGHELAAKLAVVRPEMRILFMSGFAEPTVREGGVLQPGIELLPKPFERHGLLTRVRSVLDKTPGR